MVPYLLFGLSNGKFSLADTSATREPTKDENRDVALPAELIKEDAVLKFNFFFSCASSAYFCLDN